MLWPLEPLLPPELAVILLTADPVVACGETSLASLRPGSTAIIVDVDATGPQGQRLLDLGFVPNTPIRVLRRAPLGDPSVYDVRGTRFCLRRSEARRVRVRPA
jgi:ferrous iron transport protein A